VLSSGRGYRLKIVLYIAAYVLPAAFIWGTLGILLRPLNGIPVLLPLLAVLYALRFGLLETAGSGFRPLGLAWQVPSSWIKGRPAALQTLIWGTTLGPGLVTKNPYAGMWLLPLLVAFSPSMLVAMAVGLAIGGAHGLARALGVLRNRRCIDMDENAYLRILDAESRWKFVDGLALLLAAGALAAYVLSILSVHL